MEVFSFRLPFDWGAPDGTRENPCSLLAPDGAEPKPCYRWITPVFPSVASFWVTSERSLFVIHSMMLAHSPTERDSVFVILKGHLHMRWRARVCDTHITLAKWTDHFARAVLNRCTAVEWHSLCQRALPTLRALNLMVITMRNTEDPLIAAESRVHSVHIPFAEQSLESQYLSTLRDLVIDGMGVLPLRRDDFHLTLGKEIELAEFFDHEALTPRTAIRLTFEPHFGLEMPANLHPLDRPTRPT